ncbi:DUF5916 domain-containing protein [Flavobacteriaceae sp. LMIT009]
MKQSSKLTLLCLFVISILSAQNTKHYNIQRAETSPKIDGILDDSAWEDANEAKDFIEFRPTMGQTELEGEETIVKMTYDDSAIYFAAYIHDDPSKIMKQATTRDNFGIADFFLISINPNNDGQNDLEFLVFVTGTQGDAIVTADGNEDWGWNAVWDSAVKVVDDGWIAEIKLPYSALRFSNQGEQVWSANFHRRHMDDNRQFSWGAIDLSTGKKIGQFNGEIHGIKDLNPPTRLSFFPFSSGLTRSYDGESNSDLTFGMDLKYGITENFTIDATLIPDFSQAGFDDVELNLGPFEQQFSEQRQFFKEGVDLFEKGDLFYSRRIGGRPSSFPSVGVDEELIENPNSAKVLNAVKFSGRTKNSLGIAFFNAITEKTEARIRNINTQEIRDEVIEPLANYNILVVDKQFNNNSSISLVNTNVMRSGDFRDANVTAGLFDITNKKNTYNFQGELKMSNVNYRGLDDVTTGFSGSVGFNKISGKNRFGFDYEIMDDKFDINDLGILFQNNYQEFSSYYSRRTFEPVGNINNFRFNAWFNYRRLNKPSNYTGKNVGFFTFVQFKSLWNINGNMNWNIGKQHDYWEPRTPGRFFTFRDNLNANANINSNPNKPFAFNINGGFATLFDPDRDVFHKWVGIQPRMRFTDKFTASYEFRYQGGNGGRGYVTNVGDEIIFGQRKQRTLVNSIRATYNFNSFHGLNLTFRNYWSTVAYDQKLYTLMEDGSTINTTGHTVDNIGFNPDANFNTWNLDFSYTWQFAPGSLLSALYRNSLLSYNNMSRDNFFDSLDTLFDQPIEHIFSLRMVYYVDFNNVKNLL